MIHERTFSHDAASVTAARRYVLGALGNVSESVADAAALLVSELSANAVRHTATHFTLTLDLTADHIRVSVTDSGPGQPVVRNPEPTEPSGRGLQIVEALADEWGIVPAPAGHGKTVWFTLALPGELTETVSVGRDAVASHDATVGAADASAAGATTGVRQPVRPDHRPRARAGRVCRARAWAGRVTNTRGAGT